DHRSPGKERSSGRRWPRRRRHGRHGLLSPRNGRLQPSHLKTSRRLPEREASFFGLVSRNLGRCVTSIFREVSGQNLAYTRSAVLLEGPNGNSGLGLGFRKMHSPTTN